MAEQTRLEGAAFPRNYRGTSPSGGLGPLQTGPHHPPPRGLGPGRGGWRPRVSAQAQDQRLKPQLSRTRRLQTRKGQKVPLVGCYLCDPR